VVEINYVPISSAAFKLLFLFLGIWLNSLLARHPGTSKCGFHIAWLNLALLQLVTDYCIAEASYMPILESCVAWSVCKILCLPYNHHITNANVRLSLVDGDRKK